MQRTKRVYIYSGLGCLVAVEKEILIMAKGILRLSVLEKGVITVA